MLNIWDVEDFKIISKWVKFMLMHREQPWVHAAMFMTLCLTKPISADVEACATVGPGQWRVLLRKPSRKRSLWLLGKGSTMA